ncbi:MAG: hypothetical protein ACPLPW_07700 [bacterium]
MMNTKELMQIALDLVGMKEIPADSAIHVEGEGIKRLLFAIDVSSAELLFARMNGYHCVVGHHPRGLAQTSYYAILERQTKLLEDLGVPQEEAKEATRALRESIFLSSHRANWEDTLLLAKVMEMPYLNIHNPLDELGRRLLERKIKEREKPNWKLKDLISALLEFPEIQKAPNPPFVAMGFPDAPTGRVAVFHGTGTNGGYGAAKALFRNGYDTVLYIHIDYQDLEKLRKEFPEKNLVISGHIASDMIGINPYLEELKRRGIEVLKLSDL